MMNNDKSKIFKNWRSIHWNTLITSWIPHNQNFNFKKTPPWLKWNEIIQNPKIGYNPINSLLENFTFEKKANGEINCTLMSMSYCDKLLCETISHERTKTNSILLSLFSSFTAWRDSIRMQMLDIMLINMVREWVIRN